MTVHRSFAGPGLTFDHHISMQAVQQSHFASRSSATPDFPDVLTTQSTLITVNNDSAEDLTVMC